MANLRRHERFPIIADVRIVTDEAPPDRLAVHDISMGGMFLRADLTVAGRYPVGTLCELTVFPAEETPFHRDGGSTVHAKARVVRRDGGEHGHPQGLGVAFEGVDEENLDRLRTLVRRSLD
jgi:c-di-GMP-binding flagellar brake protein YcgR